MLPLPPARVWIAVCTPSRMTRKQAKAAWLQVWRNLNPHRRVAAKQWISHVSWRRKLRSGGMALGEPKCQHLRPHDRFQPALWRGSEMTRTAAPVWVPLHWQQRLLLEDAVSGETTANRVYAPLAQAGAV